MQKLVLRIGTACAISALALTSANAVVKPNGMFTDNAILQRGIKVPVWGTAAVGERVTVKIAGQEVSTVSTDGKWMVRLNPLKAGGPYPMTISGSNVIELKNVVAGEVWVCSGQSNMEWALVSTANGKEVASKSADPMLRLYGVPNITSFTPLSDVNGTWNECRPDTVEGFSSVAYYFGRHLRKELGVPVGLIKSAWGGTPIESWMAPKDVTIDQHLTDFLKSIPQVAFFRPSSLHNAMISPIVPYGIKGAIWYQGETNAPLGYEYRQKLPTMIKNWREMWAQGDFPFLVVQLASWWKGNPEVTWAELRESQLITSQTCPNVGLAVTTDVGDPENIHPQRKEPVGDRLALAARAIAYGQKIIYRGPTYKSMKVLGDSIVLNFESVGAGLEARGGALTGFTIAGADQKFYPAEAVIDGKTVVVKSAQVPQPSAVRFGWTIYPEDNLFNKAGLPASPFRTDNWKLTTQRD